jgi:hypothetical protein
MKTNLPKHQLFKMNKSTREMIDFKSQQNEIFKLQNCYQIRGVIQDG